MGEACILNDGTILTLQLEDHINEKRELWEFREIKRL